MTDILSNFIWPLAVLVAGTILFKMVGPTLRDFYHGRKVHQWMKKNTSDKGGERYRSTRAIASGTNMTEDRIRSICSRHAKIRQSTGPKADMWGL